MPPVLADSRFSSARQVASALAEDLAMIAPTMALPGLGRALVASGTLTQARAEEIYANAQASKAGFINEAVSSGAVSARDLAHTIAQAFAAPLIDLDAVDILPGCPKTCWTRALPGSSGWWCSANGATR